MTENVQQRLTRLIDSSALSKSEIARRVGVTRSSVGHWTRTGKISKLTLKKLCQVLGVSVDEILSEENNTTFELAPLQLKAIQVIRELPKEDYYILEEVIELLTKEKK